MLATCIGLIAHSFGTISFLIVRIVESFWFLMALSVTAREIALVDHCNRLKACREAEREVKL